MNDSEKLRSISNRLLGTDPIGDAKFLCRIAGELENPATFVAYWKLRAEATEAEALLGSKYLAYPTPENKQQWLAAMNKLDKIKAKEPKWDELQKFKVPNDESIKAAAREANIESALVSAVAECYFELGAKWMRDKLTGK